MIITPLSKVVGCAIEGVSLNDVSGNELEQIRDAWLKYGVVVIKDQHLTPLAYVLK